MDHCDQCGKEFTGKNRRNNLVRHVKTHTGEKPFQCPLCSYKASRKEHMIRHLSKGSCIIQKVREGNSGQSVQPHDPEVISMIEEHLAKLCASRRKNASPSQPLPPPPPPPPPASIRLDSNASLAAHAAAIASVHNATAFKNLVQSTGLSSAAIREALYQSSGVDRDALYPSSGMNIGPLL